MTSLTYIIESTPWIAVGLLVGYFMGRSTVTVEAIADAVQEGDVMPDSASNVVRRRQPRVSGTVVLGVVIAILGVFTAVQSYVQGEATDRLAACQAAYSNGFADALDARSKASAEAQDALDELLTSVSLITPTPDGREDFKAALDGYLSKRADAKQAQAENPYPPAPRDVCGEDD